MAKRIEWAKPGLVAPIHLFFIGCSDDDDPADPGGGTPSGGTNQIYWVDVAK